MEQPTNKERRVCFGFAALAAMSIFLMGNGSWGFMEDPALGRVPDVSRVSVVPRPQMSVRSGVSLQAGEWLVVSQYSYGRLESERSREQLDPEFSAYQPGHQLGVGAFYGFDRDWGVLEFGGTFHAARISDATSPYAPTMSIGDDADEYLTWINLALRANYGAGSLFQHSFIGQVGGGKMPYRECADYSYDYCSLEQSPAYNDDREYDFGKARGSAFILDWQPSLAAADGALTLYGVAGLATGAASHARGFSDKDPIGFYGYLRTGLGMSVAWRALVFDGAFMQPISGEEIALPGSWDLKFGARF